MKKILLLLIFLPLLGISQSYQGVYYVRDSTTAFGRILPKYVLIMDQGSGRLYRNDSTTSSTNKTLETWKHRTQIGGEGVASSDIMFDSDRATQREYSTGVTIAGTTVYDFLEYLYFSPPTITCNFTPTTTLYEVGTSTEIEISGTTSFHGAATLLVGSLDETVYSTNLDTWTTETSYSYNILYTPLETPVDTFDQHAYTFEATHTWEKGIESGTATASESLASCYPYFYGVAVTDLSGASGPTIYDTLTKVVQAEGDKSVVFNGTGYSYFVYLSTWSDITEILDDNGFNVTSGYTQTNITVTSVGLPNNYTIINYKCLKSNIPGVYSSKIYQFK